MNLQRFALPLAVALLSCGFTTAVAQTPLGTAFTYQGLLESGGSPYSGVADLRFMLFDAASAGNQVGATQDVPDATITGGQFTAALDFGGLAFNGEERWLHIEVRTPAGAGAYVTLSPRQHLSAAPYALWAMSGNPGPQGPPGDSHWQMNGSATYYSAGFVGVGTSAPTTPLDVVASGDGVTATTTAGTAVTGKSQSEFGVGAFGWASSSTGLNAGVTGRSDSPDGAGVRGLNTTLTGFDFYAQGAGVDYGAPSSRRWKSDVLPIDDPLEKLAQIRGVYYTWDAQHGGHHDVGMIAEEVGAVMPEIVRYEANGIDAVGMDYGKITPLLVEAIKALAADNDDLRAEVAELRATVRQLPGKELRTDSDEH
jgi:hypothetical protein